MGPNMMFFVLNVLPFFGGVACFITNSIVKLFKLFLLVVLFIFRFPFLPLLPLFRLGLGF
jgi:hypothetical protein